VRHAHGARCCRTGEDETKRNETERVARGDGEKKRKRDDDDGLVDRSKTGGRADSSLTVFLGDDEKKEKTLLALSIITALALSLFLSSKTPGR